MRVYFRLLPALVSLTLSYNIEITEGGKITTSLSSPVDHDPEVPTRNTTLKVDIRSRLAIMGGFAIPPIRIILFIYVTATGTNLPSRLLRGFSPSSGLC